MNPPKISRRHLLKSVSSGFGYMAFAGLSSMATAGPEGSPLKRKAPHFPAPRPPRDLSLHERALPRTSTRWTLSRSFRPTTASLRIARAGLPAAKLMGSPWKVHQRGQSGLWISELFPEVATLADELCIVRSMHTDLPAHPEAYLMLHTGSSQFIRPSLGAWTLYGLGTESDDLPGFIAVKPTSRNGGAQNYGSAFLPAACQATRIGDEATPIAQAAVGNIKNPRLDTAAQRLQLDLVQSMNRAMLERERVHPGVEGVIESYELSFRMQGALPRVTDLAGESAATKSLYGLDDPVTADFGRECLLGARFVEAGVRFVELTHGDWDQHRGLKAGHLRNARSVDRPIAGLLTDLRTRGAARRDPGDLGRGIRPHATRPKLRRSRPQQQGIFTLAGRRRRKARHRLRPDRRTRIRSRRESNARARLASHDPSPARARSRAPDLSLRRTGYAADGYQGRGPQGILA